ncbi:MAG: hypothetical protein E7235_07155 [Lachnospiraceae bacterium]|nr:hypothetical protein [Lachnospiraceae bacterium]
MKKKLLINILALSLLFTGCGTQAIETSEDLTENTSVSVQSDTSSDILKEYMSNPVVLETPVHEYGESTAFIQMEDDLVIRILYPEGELTAFDSAIENWVSETVAFYQQEAIGSSNNGESAELTAQYSSYIVEDNWVSVKMTGLFDKPYNAHPEDIIYTLNASLETGEPVALDDFLSDGGRKTIEEMVINKAGITSDYIDEHLLDLWLFKSDGLEITLRRGDYLPMSEGTVTLFFTYDELKDVLTLADIGSVIPDVEENTNINESTGSDIILPLSSVDPEKPMVALTFDDGPSKHTDRLLDIFAEYGGKGTFFVVGNILDNRAETLKRTVAEGHQLAGHSWDHRQLTKLTGDDLVNQIMATRAKIYDLTGIDTPVIRPPYGSYNDEVKQVCKDHGVMIVNWSVDTLDWKYKDANTIYSTIMADVKDGDIILCHDLHGTTVDAMEMVIPALIEKGYQLVTVSELLDAGNREIIAGEVYTKK